MTEESHFEADDAVTEDRTPAACPFCGYDGAFDGQGKFTREMATKRAGVRTEFKIDWYQFRCSECNGHFQMLDQARKVGTESLS